jgi:hypothetical protein
VEYECNSTQKTRKNFIDTESYADSENFARRKKGTGTLVADPQLFYEDPDQAFFQYQVPCIRIGSEFQELTTAVKKVFLSFKQYPICLKRHSFSS